MTRHRIFLLVSMSMMALGLAAALRAEDDRREKRPQSRPATFQGKIIDLHALMTGPDSAEDARKASRKRVKSGVPVVLVAEDGLIVLGKGSEGPAEAVTALLHQEVFVNGRLYTKNGLRYLDIHKIAPAGQPEEKAVQPDATNNKRYYYDQYGSDPVELPDE